MDIFIFYKIIAAKINGRRKKIEYLAATVSNVSLRIWIWLLSILVTGGILQLKHEGNSNMRTNGFFILFISLLLFLNCASEKQSFVFSYFKNNGEDGLHLAYSQDGFHWKSLKNDQSFLTPMVGHDKLMRDPCIIYGPDKLFHMVWTVSWHERGIGYASSANLINWSEQKYIPVMEHEPQAENCWAPEVFYDDATSQYLVFWATTIPGRFPETDNQSNDGPPKKGHNHRIYFVTTRDFKTFSKTKLFYDHGFNVIDATLIKDRGRYIMFLKDESNKPFTPQKNIRVSFAEKAIGPYSEPSAPIHGNYWAEGPTAIKIGDLFYVYFDKYRVGKYGLAVSKDLKKWQDWSNKLVMPDGLRHGTVLRVPNNIVNKLLAQ